MITQIIFITLFICFPAVVSIAYLRHNYLLIDFRKNLHIGRPVKYHKGRDFFIAEIERIPGKDILIVKCIENNKCYQVSSLDIYPL